MEHHWNGKSYRVGASYLLENRVGWCTITYLESNDSLKSILFFNLTVRIFKTIQITVELILQATLWNFGKEWLNIG